MRPALQRLFAVALLVGLCAALPAAEYEGRGHMHRVLLEVDLPFTEVHWKVTGWKLLGFMGAFCFGGRWLVQWWHRRRTGLREIPTIFWVISLAGAGMVTSYFVWGKNDSVGIFTNGLPASIALYNLIQDLRSKNKPAQPAAPA